MTARAKFKIAVLMPALAAFPSAVHACAVCFGKSDAPMAQGMNMGILVLLGFILAVLGGIVVFFVFLLRRAARTNARLERPDAAVNLSPAGQSSP